MMMNVMGGPEGYAMEEKVGMGLSGRLREGDGVEVKESG